MAKKEEEKRRRRDLFSYMTYSNLLCRCPVMVQCHAVIQYVVLPYFACCPSVVRSTRPRAACGSNIAKAAMASAKNGGEGGEEGVVNNILNHRRRNRARRAAKK